MPTPPKPATSVTALSLLAAGVPSAALVGLSYLAAGWADDSAAARTSYLFRAATVLAGVGVGAYLLRRGVALTGTWVVLWTAGLVAYALWLSRAILGTAIDLRPWPQIVGLGWAVALAAWWAVDALLALGADRANPPGRGPRGALCLALTLSLAGFAVAAGGPLDWLLAAGLLVAVGGCLLFRVTVRGAEPGTLTAGLFHGGFMTVNRFVPWYRFPRYLGALNLLALRDELREKNLHDTRGRAIPEVPPPAAPPANPGSLIRRTSDGTNNDPADPLMGAAKTRFGRNMPLRDSVPEPPPGLLEPSPRVVSARLLARPDGFTPATTLNLLAAAWIQFMTHDWFHHGTPVEEDPIRVPLDTDRGDEWDGRRDFMPVRRTPPDPTNPGRPGDPPTFLNDGSHWWDGSQIYGNSEAETQALRCGDKEPGQDGVPRDTRGELRLSPDRLLPIDTETQQEQAGLTDNWWLGLSLLHTLFAQEHNAIAARLRLEYPFWDGDRVFHVARLVNVALMAKIHTVEWTPAILGHPALQVAMHGNWWGVVTDRVTRLVGRVSDSEFVSGIPGSPPDHHAAPYSLTEEFVSVYRMHPLMPETIRLHRAGDGRFVKEVRVVDTLNEKVRAAVQTGDPAAPALSLADVCYSFGVAHPGAITLHNYPHFLRRLPRPEPGDPGRVIDLAAIDVMRDRERGVPRYNRFRELLRLPRVKSFEELTSNRAWAAELRDVYKDVDRVDLMVGMFAEDPPPGFGFSETAFRIFILMASRRLKSDRFFTTDYTPAVYTQVGLDWIGQNGMTSVILRHFPEVGPAVRQVPNAFAPWTAVGPAN